MGSKGTCKAKMFDVMLGHHLRFPDLAHDLGFIGSMFSSKPAWKNSKEDMELYNVRDTDVTLQAAKQLKPMLAHEKLDELYSNVQVPLALICKRMSDIGFKIDPNRIGEVREKIKQEIVEEEKSLPDYLRTQMVKTRKRVLAPEGTLGKSGKPVKYTHEEHEEEETPWSSSDRIKKFLYKDLNLPEVADAKTGKVTSGKLALEKLYHKSHNPAILAIKNLRAKASLLNLFCKEEMLKVDRVHSRFMVHGTSSGRLSSSDPNLQNVSPAAKYIYIPSRPNYSLIDCDFSQIENRLTAWFAGDQKRLDRFLADPTFSEHKYAASVFLDCKYEDVIKDNSKDAVYGKAKRIVHLTNYGGTAKKISLLFDMDFAETKEMQAKWKKEIYKTVEWQNETASRAKREGFLATPFGRRRYFYTSSYFNEALSFLPQSTAADIIFRAMIVLMHKRIKWPEERVYEIASHVEELPASTELLVSVHDSLVFEAPTNELPWVIGVIKRVMEQGWKELGGFNIPIGIAAGPSWAECEPYTGPIL